MGKKQKGIVPNLNISSAEDEKFAKLSAKEKGKAQAGEMPDEIDKKWIQTWIDMYDRAYPGIIKRVIDDVRMEVSLSEIDKHGEVSAASGMQKAFFLPQELQQVLEVAYPSFWTSPKHAKWFCKNFPQFAFVTYTKALK